MNKATLKIGGCVFTFYYNNMDEDGYITIAILDAFAFMACVKYEVCGGKRYDYEILLSNKHAKNIMDDLLDEFTEMIVK